MKQYISFPLVSVLVACSQGVSAFEKSEEQKPNVLFVCVDDLRPDLGCYGNVNIKSPQIDRLAKTGVVFTNHFTQVPTCGASRCSMLTGMFPRTGAHLTNEAMRNLLSGRPESEIPETFVHHLKRNGYYTVGVGKVSHYVDGLLYGYTDPVGTEYELPHSWNEMLFNPGKWGTGWNAFFGFSDGTNRQSRNKQVKPYEMADVEDAGYPDGLIAEQAVFKLGELAKAKKPFFLAVGFFKPHLPFNAPQKYWDLYEESKIPLSPNPFVPENVNRKSLHESNEFNGYELGDERATLNGPVSDAYARKLRHAYYACVSYVDAQVGKLLDELEKLGLADNTIIVLWGDHGWHLGDHSVWGKHTLFERALKSAFIMRVPKMDISGKKIDRIVSSTDIYPTLMDLCQVEKGFNTDGKSIVPLLENARTTDWIDASWGYFNLGITLRTQKYRLTKYFREEKPVIELYDHEVDPWESRNVAEQYPEIVRQLLPELEKGNKGLY